MFKMQRVCADYKTTNKKGKYNPAINCKRKHKTQWCFLSKCAHFSIIKQGEDQRWGLMKPAFRTWLCFCPACLLGVSIQILLEKKIF